MQQRKTCRKFYKELRNNMSREQVFAKSQVICQKVFSSETYKSAKVILAYYPLGNEVNSLPVIEQALRDGKRVALPKTDRECRMEFYEIKDIRDVEEGNFHVMEPRVSCKLFRPTENDTAILVLVPGVVFDCIGNRYGYGKGYYDRYFARFPKLKRMALAYYEQVAETPLECLETDVRMQIIVTENEVIQTDGK